MKTILIVGDDFTAPHGIVNYTRPLAGRLARRGHEVHYFFSGSQFLAYDLLLLPRLKRFRQEGIRFHKIINSPIYSLVPGSPEADIENPTIERMFASVLAAARPDVMYVDSLMGLPSSLLEIAHRQGVPILLTHHVYRLFCQFGVFHDHEGTFCDGPGDFDRCARCFRQEDAGKYIRVAQIRSNPLLRGMLDRVGFPVFRALRGVVRTLRPGPAAGAGGGPADPDPALRAGIVRRYERNVHHLNEHVAVNIAVSEDVRRYLIRFGVRAEKIRVQHIGSLAAERFRPKQHPLDPEEVVIGNIGGLGPYKGTHVLVEALRRLRDRSNWRMVFYGKTIEAYQKEIEAMFQDPRIRYAGAYRFEDIDSLVDTVDVMVLPSVCNDTAPQTIFESFSGRVPIVASRIGGFPDFINDGENGWLFRTGDARDLAGKLDRLLAEPALIERASGNIRPLKTLDRNVAELEALFDTLARRTQ